MLRGAVPSGGALIGAGDGPQDCRYREPMEVHFTPETEAKLAQVAAENRTDAAEYVEQLVEHYIDHDRWFRAQVQEGIDQLNQGQFASHEDVGARIARLFRP